MPRQLNPIPGSPRNRSAVGLVRRHPARCFRGGAAVLLGGLEVFAADDGTHAFDVAVHQVRASPTGSPSPRSPVGQAAPHVLESEELTVLTAWAEAVVEAVSHAPERAAEVLAEGGPGAQWRAALGLPEPSGRLGAAIASMEQAVGALDVSDGKPTSHALLAAAAQDLPDEDPLDGLVRRVLLAMLEERRTRRPGSTLAQGTRA